MRWVQTVDWWYMLLGLLTVAPNVTKSTELHQCKAKLAKLGAFVAL